MHRENRIKTERPPLTEDEILQILIDLEHGKTTKLEILRRYGVGPARIEQWQQTYPLHRYLAAKTKPLRSPSLALIVALIGGHAAYVLHSTGNEALSYQVAPLIILAFLVAGFDFTLESIKKGVVNISHLWKRSICRNSRPAMFWAIISAQAVGWSMGITAVALTLLRKL